jgi:hypothetical protein
LPFLHADLFLGELRGQEFGLGLLGKCLTLRDSEASAQLAHERHAVPACREVISNCYRAPFVLNRGNRVALPRLRPRPSHLADVGLGLTARA